MRNGNFLLWLGVFIWSISSLSAQNEKNKEEEGDTKKSKATQKAEDYFKAKEYALAEEAIKGAFSKEKSREVKKELTFMLGDCYRFMLDYKQAANQYKKAVKLEYGPDAQYWYAEMLKSQGQYEEALVEFEALKAMKPGDKRAEMGIETCKMSAEWKNNPSRYIVEPEAELNSKLRDMTPIYSGRPGTYDEVYIISSREGAIGNKEDGWTGESFMDIWMAARERKAGKPGKGRSKGSEPLAKFSVPVPLDESINSKEHEGPMAFDSRRKQMFFTRCRTEKFQVLGCSIYTTEKRGQTWDAPELVVLAPDSTYSVGHPSLSPDDKILYFAGNLPGALGDSKDIWMTTFDRRTKKWADPINLGPLVNTEGDELFPFAHDDGYLYFSSNGQPGMGGLDIFRIKLTEDGMPTGKAENLKYPINTEFEDFGIILEAGGAKKGFISSNRNKGNDDIFSIFEVPLLFQLEGVVSSTKDKKPIPQVTVRLDGSDGTSIVANTDGNGRYVFEKDKLAENTTYRLSFEKKKYLNGFSDATTVGVPFSAFEYNAGERFFLHTLKLDKGIEPIEVPIVLPNVLFDLGKWDLRPESMLALDSVVAILQNNPNVVIELRSHTDYRDTDEKNRTLSQNRADTCVKYLISKGVAGDRLVAVGKGETEPLTIPEAYKGLGKDLFKAGAVLTEEFIKRLPANQQEVANQINRRTDFKVLRDDYVPNQVKETVPGQTTEGSTDNKADEKPKVKGEIYVVENAKENFGVIAKKFNITIIDLKKINGGLRGVRPFEGLQLKVTPEGDYSEYDAANFRVDMEKSLKEVAKKAGVDVKVIKELNPDLKDSDLLPGRTVKIQ